MSENTKTTTVITLELLDGREFEFTTRTHMCAADRVAFEKQFGITSAALARMGSRMSAVSEGAVDPAALTDLSDMPDELNEAWLMFFSWRCAVRAIPEVFAQMPFDRVPDDLHPMGGFVQQLAEYDQDDDSPKPDQDDERVDPTEPGALSA